MKTISAFILLIYWSIMIFAPVMSKDIKFSRAKINNIKIAEKSISCHFEASVLSFICRRRPRSVRDCQADFWYAYIP